jgi:hypothetical protein
MNWAGLSGMVAMGVRLLILISNRVVLVDVEWVSEECRGRAESEFSDTDTDTDTDTKLLVNPSSESELVSKSSSPSSASHHQLEQKMSGKMISVDFTVFGKVQGKVTL